MHELQNYYEIVADANAYIIKCHFICSVWIYQVMTSMNKRSEL